MTYEELKAEFARLNREEKQRFMEEVGLGLCEEMMSDGAFMERMMPRCQEMMNRMPAAMRRRMQECMGAASGGRKT